MNSKKAITLAEIMIVLVIVAVIALVFFAMPKKDVGKMDRAKYYVAYDMLKRLMDEQMAENGEVKIDTDKNFCNAINTWLNIVGTLSCTTTPAPTKATLTNGMVLSWGSNYDASDENDKKRTVTVDLDGEGEDTQNEEDKDIQSFILHEKNGRVEPNMNGNTTWIAFKVYKFKNNGDAEFVLTNAPYYDAYYCLQNLNMCGEDHDQPCCGNNCSDNNCYIEAIPPLK